jgi:hypothetical protein
MSAQRWIYPPELVDALVTFGFAPTSATPPRVVRDALNDLYRYEIRRLRQRLLDGHMAKAEYVPAVIALRKQYWPLSLQPAHWEKICRNW